MGDFSNNSPKATIFGGTGFLGRYIVQRLARQGWIIDVITRNPSEGLFLKTLGYIGQINLVQGDFDNFENLKRVLKQSNALVNCVGILNESANQKFKILHCDVPAKLAQYASDLGVDNFINISSIGADKSSSSNYAKSKGLGEIKIREAFPRAIILRSSVIFGAEDQFFNLFSSIASLSPVIPVVGGKTLFQPVYVDDIAFAVEKILTDEKLIHKTGVIYELGGSEVFSFRDLIQKMLFVIKRRRFVLEIPFWIANIMCPLVYIANKASFNTVPLLITKDQIKQLKKNNITSSEMLGFEDLGILPRVMDAILPTYLNRYRPKGQFYDP